MSYRRVIQLWEGNNEETHGGENNGGARRVPCARNSKYSDLEGLSTWANRRAFGVFWSGHSSDPVRGGGSAGQENTVDYITGMPDLRTEHLHAIDCGGFDRLRIVWMAECLDYEGLSIDWASVPDPTNNVWADSVYAAAWGAEVIAAGLDYVNFPPGIWANANDSLALEGSVTTSGGIQSLADNDVNNSPTVEWSVTGGFAVGTAAVYTHATGTGTLTQATADFISAVHPSKRYILKYEVSSSTLVGSMALSGIGTLAGMPITNGTHVVTFTTAASPGNFVLTVTSTSGSITIDNIFLMVDMTAGADRRPRPMIESANNSSYNEPNLLAVQGALAIRGQSFVFGGDDVSRYGIVRVSHGMPRELPIAHGAMQWGVTQKIAGGATYGRIPRAGDRYKVVFDVGLPLAATSGSASPGGGYAPMAADLWITGIERVYFSMCSVGVGFGTGAPEYLVSSPIGPATAPRQHIKGRLYAVLSSMTPHPKGSPV